MNKAFTREPDHAETARCPRCGSLGLPVGQDTLASFLLPQALSTLAESAFFCPYPTCEIVYFDMFHRALGAASIQRGVYPKDPNAPICGCFGLTLDDVELDVREGVVTRCRALIGKAKSEAARCSIMSPWGQNCVSEVQRQYMKRRQAHDAQSS